MERGASVTTAEIAGAAGIAEGTIFRVFPDKAALVHEAVRSVMDPAQIVGAIEAIPEDLPMRSQLEAAAGLMSFRLGRIASLMGVLRSLPLTSEFSPTEAHRIASNSLGAISDALAALFERHRRHLSLPPARAAMAFQSLVFTNAHPVVAADKRLTIDEVIEVTLSGVVATSEMADEC